MLEAGFDSSQVEVLENGVPLRDVTPMPREGPVAYIGGMNTEKGVATVLAAAHNLPQCRFVFVGDGPEREKWAAAAPANCKFMGARSRSEVDDTYRESQFVVVPSLWWEPFGLVAVEAMSHGRAVVAAEMGALSGLVDHGVNGVLFPPGDVSSLINAIRLLWENPQMAEAMGQSGRQKVEKSLNDELYADRLLRIYGRLEVGHATL